MKRIFSMVLAGVMTVAAAGSAFAGEYRNFFTLERFEAALMDRADYGTYRNVARMEAFVATLGDQGKASAANPGELLSALDSKQDNRGIDWGSI